VKLLKSFYQAMKLLQQLRRINSWMMVNLFIALIEKYRLDLLKESRYQDPLRLNRYEHQVYSQNGEDGIIAEIFRRVEIGNKNFLEIGVGNGLENNTAFLLLQGWTGFWIDGDEISIRFIQRHFQKPIQDGRLRALSALVTAENIGNLFEQAEVPRDITFLSLDIDRNTYWLLDALLKQIQPIALVVEYNGIIPSDIDWKVEYDPTRMWNGTSYTSASLKAYEILCKKYSYSLVGCDLCGINAFFVRADLCKDQFAQPYTSENHYEPLRDFLVHRVGPERSFSDIT
jgi:hypothetical protein